MSKNLQLAAVSVVGLLLLAVAAGCGGGGGGDEAPPPPPALVITTTTMPDGVTNTAYSQTVAVSGGTGARTFSITVGTLPTGLNIDASTGVISGTPTATGTSNFTVQVVDSGTPQQTDTQALTLDINAPLVITTTTLPDAAIGTAYNATVVATGGSGALTFTISSGAAPAGITMNAAGVFSGVPGAGATTQTFTVRVADGSSPQQVDTQVLTIAVTTPLSITTTFLPSGTVGVAYAVAMQAIGGVPPYTFAVTTGNLPSMLNLAGATALISGTPDTVETQNFIVTVTDSTTNTDTQSLSIAISNVSPGRNDSIATATALSNGTYAASISPFGDPEGVTDPDEDFYEIAAAAGSVVTITVVGPGLSQPSELDPVVEIVNASGTRFSTCRDPGDNSVSPPITQDATPAAFNDQCVNDDIDLGITRDSMLEFQVPGAGAVTFFVRVIDFRGDARPDLRYEITISGAN